jgi:hypothetical protein
MESIWMGIAPGVDTTRVIAMAAPSETILKAQLSKDPLQPPALATLLEAVALWQGQPVRAALCADAGGLSCDSWKSGIRALRLDAERVLADLPDAVARVPAELVPPL